MSHHRINRMIEQSEMVRRVLKGYLTDLTPDQWFWTPGEGLTHVAWQIGHLAASEYALLMKRVRGAEKADQDFMPDAFFAQYGRGSTPDPDPSANWPVDDILLVFDDVHDRCMAAAADYDEAELVEPLEQPHPVFKTKLAAIEYQPIHEAMHIGQVVLLRRLMGKAASW
ncbi:DinB superfamily protein [Pirellulimonas nuda]|uniref:DinB superfamily protein n=1 Tax=Pirellulimonas nuda TaxID=2528009 RepID=A0A518D8B7_9BACT|nr:DinB family protein [Pirellulimonas nuda]QDU87732.1 DinB superfamily protein [Pirellulimonas nuda]